MGLDCYWVKPGEMKSAPLDFDPPLCFETDSERRLWSSEGWAIFPGARGFDDFISDMTGYSLHARLTTGKVLLIAGELDVLAAQLENFVEAGVPLPQWRFRRDGSPVPRDDWEYLAPEVYRDIARMFRAYSEAGYELSGSW